MEAFPHEKNPDKRMFTLRTGLQCVCVFVCWASYLGYNSLSCDVVFKKELVSLNEELTRVFLFGCRPFLPQNDRTMRTLLF